MGNLNDFSIMDAYEQIKFKDKPAEIDKIIDWNALKKILKKMYHNDTDEGGRPNFDEIIIIKIVYSGLVQPF